jgi:putative transposase
MPRGPRLDAPGVFHHVWARGIEKRKIFLSDEDREDFLQRLTVVCQGGAAFIYAWSLLDNHFHLAIRTGKMSLSTVMRRVMTGYAVGFNRKRKRAGHLFQNRFGSTIVDAEEYFLRLVRYIHLNPVWAGMVRNLRALAKYKWTGHSVLMGHSMREFQIVDDVLARFANRAGPARKALVEFMGEDGASDDMKTFEGGGLIRSMGGTTEVAKAQRRKERQLFDERVLGDGDFVERVLKQIEGDEQPLKLNQKAVEARLVGLLNRACELAGIQIEELTSGSRRRKVVRVREAVAFLAIRRLGFSGARVARALGVQAQSARRSVEHGEDSLKELGLNEQDFLN